MRLTNDQLRAFIEACLKHGEPNSEERAAATRLAADALVRLQNRTP